MLDPDMVRLRRAYKIGTDKIASWIVATADAAGFQPLDSAQKVPSTVSASSSKKQTITTAQYIARADHIAKTAESHRPIPNLNYILNQIDSVIELRTRYMQQRPPSQDAAGIASDRSHEYFVETLSRVKDSLRHCLARTQLQPGPDTTANLTQEDGRSQLRNRFEHLTFFDISSSSSNSSSVSALQGPAEATEGEPTIKVTHQFEVLDSKAEEALCLQYVVENYQALRLHGKHVWAKAKGGEIDRSSAALATSLLVREFQQMIVDCEDEMAELNPQANISSALFDLLSASVAGRGFDQDVEQLRRLRAEGLPLLQQGKWPSDLIQHYESSTGNHSAEIFCICALAVLRTIQTDKEQRKDQDDSGESEGPGIRRYEGLFLVRDDLMVALGKFITSPSQDPPSLALVFIFSLYVMIDQVVDDTIPAAKAWLEGEVVVPREQLVAQLATYEATPSPFRSLAVIESVREDISNIDMILRVPPYEIPTSARGKEAGYLPFEVWLWRSAVLVALFKMYCDQVIHRGQKRVTEGRLRVIHTGLFQIYHHGRDTDPDTSPWPEMEVLIYVAGRVALLGNIEPELWDRLRSPYLRLAAACGISAEDLQLPVAGRTAPQLLGKLKLSPLVSASGEFLSHRTIEQHRHHHVHTWHSGHITLLMQRSGWRLQSVEPPDAAKSWQASPPSSTTASTTTEDDCTFRAPGPGDKIILLPAGFPASIALHIAIQEQELNATRIQWKAVEIATNLILRTMFPEAKDTSIKGLFLLIAALLRDDHLNEELLGVAEARDQLNIHSLALELQEAREKITFVKGEWRRRLEQSIFMQVGHEPDKPRWFIARSLLQATSNRQ